MIFQFLASNQISPNQLSRCEAEIYLRHGDIPLCLVTFPRCHSDKTLVLWLVLDVCQFGISGVCRHSEFKAEMRVHRTSQCISLSAMLKQPHSCTTACFSRLASQHLNYTNQFAQEMRFVVRWTCEWHVNFSNLKSSHSPSRAEDP